MAALVRRALAEVCPVPVLLLRYVSKTVQDRHTVSMGGEYEVVCSRLNDDIVTSSDLHLTFPNDAYFMFLVLLHVFGKSEAR